MKEKMCICFTIMAILLVLHLPGLPSVSSQECIPRNGKELENCSSHGNITIMLNQGVYKIEGNISLSQSTAVTIVGNDACIQCMGQVGLEFSGKTMINISDVTISNCGMEIRNYFGRIMEPYGVMIAFLVQNSSMVTLSGVIIEDSLGVGLALINCTGTIRVHNSKFNRNHLKQDNYLNLGGGGINIQQMQHLNSSTEYEITGCSFTSNNASIGNFKLEKKPLFRDSRAYLLFGKGGGLSINFDSISAHLMVSNCIFDSNIAHRGGGLFLSFLGHSRNNLVSIRENNFTANQCTTQNIPESTTQNIPKSIYSAGGAISLLYHSNNTLNKCHISACHMSNNTAYYGGGLSMGAEKVTVHERVDNGSIFMINNCHFESNSAHIGSAMDFFCCPTTENLDSECTVTPTIKDIELVNSCAGDERGRTFSTLHLEHLHANFEGDLAVTNNRVSGIWLETAMMNINTNASIILRNNSGQNGGGIVALGESQITLQRDSTLALIENVAMEAGGGIYIEQPHNFFSMHPYTCFLQYFDEMIEPNKWKVNVTFYQNRANGHFNAIFASSMYPCVWPGTNNSDILSTFCEWECFNFYGENCTDLIQTLPRNFTKERYQVELYPHNRTKIDHFGVLDDFGHDVTKKSHFTTFLVHNSPTTTIELDLTHKGLFVSIPEGQYLISVQTASISTFVNTTVLCPVGYTYGDDGCTCSIMGDARSILQCDESTHQLNVFIGYCAGIDEKERLVYSKCPFTANFFEPTHKTNFSRESFNERFCKSFKRTGFLCQKCEENCGINIFSPQFDCIWCNQTLDYVNWTKALALVIVPQMIFFLIMIVFHIGITAPAMNGYIFFSHVITLPLTTLILQSAWTLDLSSQKKSRILTDILLNPYRIWNFDYPEIFTVGHGVCLNESLQIMHAIAFRYISALFPIVLLAVTLLFIELHARNCKPVVYMWKPLCFLCVRLRRKWEVKTSVIDVFASFILLSYSKVINTSLYLLTRNFVRDSNGTHVGTRLDYDTSVVYLVGHHKIYASIAIAILSTFGLIPPVLLLLYPNQHFFKLLTKLKLDRWHGLHVFVETFHGSFKNRANGLPERRWFAGIYFIFRIIVFTVFAISEELVQLHLYLTFIYIAFLLLLVFLRPYKRNFYTCLDSFFIAILIAANSTIVYCTAQVQLKQSLPRKVWRFTYALLWIPTIYLVMYIIYLLCARSRSRFIQRCCISSVRRFQDTALTYFADRPQQRSETLLTNDASCNVTADLPTHSSLDISITPDRVDNPHRYYSMNRWSNNFGKSVSVVTVNREKDRE